MSVAVVVWVMVAIAFWHFAVLVPDRFVGGIVGAFLAALAGGLASGYLLPSPGLPAGNPPGVLAAVWPVPGAVLGLAACYAWGARAGRRPEG